MLARLILALLLAAFALPVAAPAACHDGRSPAAHAMAMAGQAMAGQAMAGRHSREERAAPAHGCIGCIPPSDWRVGRVIGAVLPEGVAPVGRVGVLAIGVGVAPALPPPRGA